MTGDERPRRSALYLPASNPRAIAKARGLPCDVVILDLEDAVAAEAKPQARAAAVAAIREGGFGRRELVVRVNALSTPWGADDCAALAQTPPAAVLLPKVDDPAAVAAYAARLGGVALWAMVETAAAVLRLDALAGAPGLAALVMGTNDLAKELRARPGPDRLPLTSFLSQAVAAARAHGLAVLDGVYNAIDDADGFARECAQGAAFGFDGKTLIHPAQIAACNTAFSPDADEVARAEAIVAAFADPAAAGRGAIRLDGAMVERLHLDQAHRTLALARAATD
jgi:citrate lyase subunit beta/citryl-CoA lyase